MSDLVPSALARRLAEAVIEDFYVFNSFDLRQKPYTFDEATAADLAALLHRSGLGELEAKIAGYRGHNKIAIATLVAERDEARRVCRDAVVEQGRLGVRVAALEHRLAAVISLCDSADEKHENATLWTHQVLRLARGEEKG